MLRQLYDYDSYNTRLQDELHLLGYRGGRDDDEDEDAYSYSLLSSFRGAFKGYFSYDCYIKKTLQDCSFSYQRKTGGKGDNDAYLLNTFEKTPGVAFITDSFSLLRLLYPSSRRKKGGSRLRLLSIKPRDMISMDTEAFFFLGVLFHTHVTSTLSCLA